MPFRRFALTGLLLSLLLPSLSLAEPSESPLGDLDEWIKKGMADWEIPGLAIAVVHEDEIIYQKGFGRLDMDEASRVDAHTLFGVASTTKAMTVAALGMLVDEGKLDWDDRVVDHMPEFRLSDPWVTHEVRVRDLLTHRVGVGRMTGNRLQFMNASPRGKIIHQMRYHDFEQPFRSSYVYSNVMYSVAGELIPAITGQSWDDFLAERLFEPLGMDRSNTSIRHLEGDNNVAWPHQEIHGEVERIPRRNFDNVGPSASVNSSVHDMAQWMRLQLGEPGVHGEQRLISAETMAEMHQAQIATGRDDHQSPVEAYGLGWGLAQYRGMSIARHGGATDGMNTQLVLVPELDLGVVVVSNLFNHFRMALANTVIDRVAGLEEKDWHQQYLDDYQAEKQEARKNRQAIHDARQEDTTPSVALEEFVGRYQDDLYGEVEVFSPGDGRLALRFWDDEEQIADLEHWHHDRFRYHWRNPARRENFAHFTLDGDGQVDTLKVTFTLRPHVLQIGTYPADYQRTVHFERIE
ncbi:CubicO group peptidase (beta-lactamase class C family) [Natronospira proteinivora]|uniref:CubicO group peptidase (Beta-lactamase class C family) n=1 Tax=Natronospira proteinivora TaxID=1807133 RepID=A0ABT1G4G7_9GAMM|nr:serine hydrolase [Natronospira proteinivora]MCP1726184.1 CubicO group peptidase (beta-lactamase class C family) [Natronospira proteinivora]